MDRCVTESLYYARHFRLPGFSEKTQKKLRSAKVLIVGVGGLGCPAALYLAAAGVGKIALCDADDVSATNLHRQVLFDTSCVGEKKTAVAAKRLQAINPYICIETICQYADARLLTDTVSCFDVVIDCTDNFQAKYAINDVSEFFGVPLVYGSIFQFEGQISVFHHPTVDHPRGLSYRDLFPEMPPSALTQNCGEAGVMGVLPGIIGTIQANEAIKLITGLGETLSGYLLTFDLLSSTSRRFVLARRNHVKQTQEVAHEIAYGELLNRMQSRLPPILIDVRELSERQKFSIGGMHIPLATLPRHYGDLPKNRAIIVYCKSGMRSAKAVLYLRSVMSGVEILSLKDGIDARTDGNAMCGL